MTKKVQIRKLVLVIFYLGLISFSYSQTYNGLQFAQKDTNRLYLDLYKPTVEKDNGYCIIYVFGGGFVSGKRNSNDNVKYCQALADSGYSVAAIDYRLGLVGVNKMGLTMIKVLERAIDMAVEDLYSATVFLLENKEKYAISPDKIVLTGTSAGAITVLEADYKLSNEMALSKILPKGFRYAGVISYSGAVFSRNGKVKYQNSPAPTLFHHGTADRLVTYNQIRCFNIGFFGTKRLLQRFQKFNYSYYAKHYNDWGHEVAGMLCENIDLTNWFIDNYINKKRTIQIDSYLTDYSYETPWYSRISPSKLYKSKVEDYPKLEYEYQQRHSKKKKK